MMMHRCLTVVHRTFHSSEDLEGPHQPLLHLPAALPLQLLDRSQLHQGVCNAYGRHAHELLFADGQRLLQELFGLRQLVLTTHYHRHPKWASQHQHQQPLTLSLIHSSTHALEEMTTRSTYCTYLAAASDSTISPRSSTGHTSTTVSRVTLHACLSVCLSVQTASTDRSPTAPYDTLPYPTVPT